MIQPQIFPVMRYLKLGIEAEMAVSPAANKNRGRDFVSKYGSTIIVDINEVIFPF